jgi:hypothetical protein
MRKGRGVHPSKEGLRRRRAVGVPEDIIHLPLHQVARLMGTTENRLNYLMRRSKE